MLLKTHPDNQGKGGNYEKKDIMLIRFFYHAILGYGNWRG